MIDYIGIISALQSVWCRDKAPDAGRRVAHANFGSAASISLPATATARIGSSSTTATAGLGIGRQSDGLAVVADHRTVGRLILSRRFIERGKHSVDGSDPAAAGPAQLSRHEAVILGHGKRRSPTLAAAALGNLSVISRSSMLIGRGAAIAVRFYLSSQTSSMRQPLKMLLTMTVHPLTWGCQHVARRS